jgi:hypothetical protein
MASQTIHGWHCHTVSGERWVHLKADYVHRCGTGLVDQAAARERARLAEERRLEAEAAIDPFPGLD